MPSDTVRPTLIYCTGPSAFPEDRRQLLELDARLQAGGFRSYIPFRDGLDTLYHDLPDDKDVTRLKLARAIFAFNTCRLIKGCDALLFCMNGRVPDEGGLVAAALAAMTGIPVVLYKQDHRSTFHGFDNAMITGLSRRFSTVNTPDKINRAIWREIKDAKWDRDKIQLPPAMATAVALGQKLTHKLNQRLPLSENDKAGTTQAVLTVYQDSNQTGLQTPATETENRQDAACNQAVIYCSGPLFCPGEVNAMTGMARTLENSGWRTYLPHRDGVEAFIMKNTDSYSANLIRPLVRFFHRLTFAVDVYFILHCHCLVFNLNGRVPDEGGVVEIGLAFAAGKPVILYREPSQTAGPGPINGFTDLQADPMIIGTMALETPAKTMEQIPEQIDLINRSRYRPEDITGSINNLSSHMRAMTRLGGGAEKIMKRITFLKPGSIF